jgi:hypothetical protein
MTASEEARRDVLAWAQEHGRLGYTSQHTSHLEAEHDLIARLTPVYERAQDGMSVVAGEAIERAKLAEANVARLRSALSGLVAFYECVMKDEDEPLTELDEPRAVLAATEYE